MLPCLQDGGICPIACKYYSSTSSLTEQTEAHIFVILWVYFSREFLVTKVGIGIPLFPFSFLFSALLICRAEH